MKLKSALFASLLCLGSIAGAHAGDALYVAKTVYKTGIEQEKVSRVRLFVHTGSSANDCSIQIGKSDALSMWDSMYVKTVPCVYSAELNKVFITEDAIRAIGDRATYMNMNLAMVFLNDAEWDRIIDLSSKGQISKEQVNDLGGLINRVLGNVTHIRSLDLGAPTDFTFSDGKADQVIIQISKKRDL